MRIGNSPSDQPLRHMTVRKFREYADFLVELFHLDPELSEIADLKAHAQEAVANEGTALLFLSMLNPDKGVYYNNQGVKVLDEQMFGNNIFRPWSLARHHIPGIDVQLVKIVADYEGTHLFGGGAEEYEMFLCVAALSTRGVSPILATATSSPARSFGSSPASRSTLPSTSGRPRQSPSPSPRTALGRPRSFVTRPSLADTYDSRLTSP